MEIINLTLTAAVFCFISLGIMILITVSKLRQDLSEPRGSSTAGIIYAFTKGLMPQAKESASHHLLSYTAGILFHIGILAAFCFSVIIYLVLTEIAIPDWLLFLIVALIIVGLTSGSGLLIKRFVNKRLRAISNFDDYFSNIIVNVFLLSTLIFLFSDSNAMLRIMYIVEGILFLYIPFGKLRHSAYFFATRIMFGTFYGRRGVLPANRKSVGNEPETS
ncbi:MAG: hypothetical protein KAS70_01960 [Planctomycetes bacterium]|nr:hypothetical protein [Planctomycetota bacterium]